MEGIVEGPAEETDHVSVKWVGIKDPYDVPVDELSSSFPTKAVSQSSAKRQRTDGASSSSAMSSSMDTTALLGGAPSKKGKHTATPPQLPEIQPEEIRWDQPRAKLGEGAFGVVYRCRNKGFRGQTIAAKIIPTGGDQELVRRCLLEAQHLFNLRHANVVNYLGVVIEPQSAMLITELCDGGSLAGQLYPRSAYRSAEAKNELVHGIAAGLAESIDFAWLTATSSPPTSFCTRASPRSPTLASRPPPTRFVATVPSASPRARRSTWRRSSSRERRLTPRWTSMLSACCSTRFTLRRCHTRTIRTCQMSTRSPSCTTSRVEADRCRRLTRRRRRSRSVAGRRCRRSARAWRRCGRQSRDGCEARGVHAAARARRMVPRTRGT